LYRYFQTGEKTSWEPIQDSQNVEEEAIKQGAKKVTILAVSEILDENTDRETLSYKGPLHFDIDVSGDIGQAIASTRELVRKLNELGVPDWAIHIYASGSKGFHVIVAASLFSSGRPIRGLPAIYKEMALELYVLGLDFQVYSGGRGVTWRLPNIQRDNGRYRVPITVDELYHLTAEDYSQLTSTPRIIPPAFYDPEFKAIGLEALMERAKRRARSRPRQPEPVPDSDLDMFREDPPPCISELVEYKVRPSKNFNQVSHQVAIFIARSGMEEALSGSLVSRLAANGESSSYNSARSRQDHITGLVSYLKTVPNTKFACNAMRSVMINRPCSECGLCQTGDEDAEPGEEVGLVERSDGYHVLGNNGDRRISTFTLEPIDAYYEQSQSGKEIRRVGATLEVCRDGQMQGTVMFKEGGWGSKSTFKAELCGIGNVAFYGTEDDIQRIKHIVFDEGRDMGEIIQVYSAGMHRYQVGARDVMVYVEPSMSINQYRVRGTHRLEGKINSPPCVKSVDVPKIGDTHIADVLRNLMQVNEPSVVAQALGWFTICHLRVHLMKLYQQFPLLSLWGQAGAGKTMTAVMFSGLNGCNPASEDGSLSLAGITPFAVTNFCSSTTTIPRILEEYNKSKLTQRNYDHCGEVMKMSWNQQVIAKGTLRRSNANGKGRSGAEVVEYPISSPLVITSEQAPQMPALKQRMVQVQMTLPDIQIEDRQRAFFMVQRNGEALRSMAKAMVISALNVKEDWIREQMGSYENLLPEDLIARPRYSYQALMLGLDFFQHVVDDLKLEGISVASLKDALLDDLTGRAQALYREKMRTEIDIIMDEIGILIQQTLNKTSNWLHNDVHYIIKGDRVYFDVAVTFANYKLYKNNLREPMVIEDSHQFIQLIQHEPYCVSTESMDGARFLGLNRPTLELDMVEMANKGLDVTLYG
jgi:hypothetical protein